MKSITLLIVAYTAFLFSSCVAAKTVSMTISNNVTANAQYEKGDTQKPLIIFIHGFLQTNSFSTVKRLYDAFYENNYSVLAPNLSLGISSRAKSLACESIHLHSLDSDTEEIRQWVDWSIHQGHKQIVLIGHSAGSVNITAYLAANPNPAVIKTILISLTHYGDGRPDAYESAVDEKKALQFLKNGEDTLHEFALSYCKRYLTLPSKFLSYYRWSGKKVLQALSKSTSDNYIIIGSADSRISKQWLAAMKNAHGKIRIINGANHFFDQAHEFDLLDQVESILDEE